MLFAAALVASVPCDGSPALACEVNTLAPTNSSGVWALMGGHDIKLYQPVSDVLTVTPPRPRRGLGRKGGAAARRVARQGGVEREGFTRPRESWHCPVNEHICERNEGRKRAAAVAPGG
jgi:hypothetical protein